MLAKDLPRFENLPKVPGTKIGCSWGLFDKDGERDHVGCLNLLTPNVVQDAAKEIVSGVSVSLNWPLDNFGRPGFARKPLEHRIVDNAPTGFVGHDDELHFNTQCGSQWDGFRHWGHQSLKLYYNGLKHEEISGPNPLPHNGIEHWNKRGCVVGRGVLIDYASWAEAKGITYNPFTKHSITLEVVEEIAKEEGLEFKPGDILLLRTGLPEFYEKQSAEMRIKSTTESHSFTGFEGSETSIPWLWNNHFAAVASDAVAFEAHPSHPSWGVHDWCLSLLGIPIGELWDLGALAAECKKRKKWSFFLTSSPLNVKGGVASPPNAVAIL